MRFHLPPPFQRLTGALPLRPLELALRPLIRNAMAARPHFIDRLGAHAGCVFAIDPVDCPFAFLITFRYRKPLLCLVPDASTARHDARIAAPLIVLLGMLDGTYDGDALFFSRDLVIEGDIEAVLALRNAIEDAELDPATVVGFPDSLKPPFNRSFNTALGMLRGALDSPEGEARRDGMPSA